MNRTEMRCPLIYLHLWQALLAMTWLLGWTR